MSPGIRFGFAKNKCSSLSFKISFGINTDCDLNKSNYYNITIGLTRELSKDKDSKFNQFNFIQLQAGEKIRETPLFYGGGIGIIFNQNKNRGKIGLISTFDIGSIIFASYNILIRNTDNIQTNFGFLGVLPIPLSKCRFGFN